MNEELCFHLQLFAEGLVWGGQLQNAFQNPISWVFLPASELPHPRVARRRQRGVERQRPSHAHLPQCPRPASGAPVLRRPQRRPRTAHDPRGRRDPQGAHEGGKPLAPAVTSRDRNALGRGRRRPIGRQRVANEGGGWEV